ncbi:MAG TPA: hypothetical protein VN643_06235 [Pyrinomonadaceae bacterium]|nr:hypothetical protein [Pyrinomonadaceae bacterium]
MSEEDTQNLNGGRSFEERVFARFDAVDSRFDSTDSRFDSVDLAIRDLDGRVQTLEARSYDTKPIWERALAEILETRRELGETKNEVVEVRRELVDTRRYFSRRVDNFMFEMAETKHDLHHIQNRVDKLESKQDVAPDKT